MRDSKSVIRGWVLPTVLLAGFLVFIALAGVAPLNTSTYRMEAQKSNAQLGCQQIATAIEAYVNSPLYREPRWPTTLRDLTHPPHSGQSLLRNGDADTVDPWGQPFQFETKIRPDGNADFLVWTTAPDGTLISQYGIGPNARPRPE